MRGLIDAYNKSLEDTNKYYLKEEIVKRAKNKLLREDFSEVSYMKYSLNTQKGAFLLAESYDKGKCFKYNLSIPMIRGESNFGVYNLSASYVSFKDLQKCINTYKKFKVGNTTVFGKLRVNNFYNKQGNFLVGMVGRNIVFMFYFGALMSYCKFSYNGRDSILIVFDSIRKYRLNLEDYSLECV